MTTKMTNRDFLNAVLSSNISEEYKAFAQSELDKMDARNAKRSSTQTQTQKDNEVLKEQILSILTNEGQLTTSIAVAVGKSTNKVSALCRQLVEEGKAKVEDVKVPKKGVQKAYSLSTNA